ncbi:MAG: ABC-ATPase domain-containing protein [Elainellaceae cyanobacterium]
MQTADDLYDLLLDLDQKSYRAYKQIKGHYAFEDFTLIIDHVQGDPFAAPSRVRVQVPQRDRHGNPIAGFPAELFHSRSREIALRDYLTRQFDQVASRLKEKRGSGKSGLVALACLGVARIAPPVQQVLERSALWVNAQQVEARFVVGLPARGRSILGRQAAELLCDDIEAIVHQALTFKALDADAIRHHVEVVEDADWLRKQLASCGLVAFVANGAILPRQSGVSDKPLTQNCVLFKAPEELQVEFQRPNHGAIAGMGIPKGITLIVGGGYHGKSTLLRAIATGVYNHIPGDGREAVVTDRNAVKIRAEDGRSITGVDISPFINCLPQGRSTAQFTTENASGSTSQAANTIEALEMGAMVLLVDEDTSATNFMIRDRRMQALIAKAKEPITPFIDKIRQIYDGFGVSTVLVMGGCGDYFDVADTVMGLESFEVRHLTQAAKAIAKAYATHRTIEGGKEFGHITHRIPKSKRLDLSQGKPQSKHKIDDRGPKLKARDTDELRFGGEDIDLTAVEQLVDVAQLHAIGGAIARLQESYLDYGHTLRDVIERIIRDIEGEGLDRLTRYPQGDMAMFRSFELAAAINRLRSLEICLPNAHQAAANQLVANNYVVKTKANGVCPPPGGTHSDSIV